MGRFDAARWRTTYGQLFSDWELVHNRRRTVKIEVSTEGDGAFAVVDIDTLWSRQDGADEMRWKGRVCKVYALVGDEWKMTMHTGVLRYPFRGGAAAFAGKWIDVWSRAWPAADVEAIAGLYSPDAVFSSHPFRNRQDPRKYVEWAFSDQVVAECRFGEPVVSGDRAAVDWWGVITSQDGSAETIAGTSLLRFNADGLVVEQRDAWASQPGRHDLEDWAQ